MDTEHQHTAQSALSASMENLRSMSRGSELYETQEQADAAWREHLSRQRFGPLWRAAGAPDRQAKLDTLEGEEWLAQFAKLKAKLGTGFLVAIIGHRGPGKTQMGVEMIREACKHGLSALYTTAFEFFLTVKESYGDGSKKREAAVIADFARPALLVIDETQERGETQWEDRMLTHLIDRRYRDERDTILIANLKEKEFIASMGQSVASRLVETGGIIACNWPSWRTQS